MELLQEGIIYLEKRIKGIAFDLNMAKAIKMILYSMTIVAAIAICILVGLVITDTSRFTFAGVVASVIVFGVYIWWIWLMSPSIIEDYNKEIIDLENQKIECERGIEKYKNDMIDLREMEKRKTSLSLTKLTEKQTDELNYYTEKAKQFFKWLIVTKDGEVVASDLKPEYNEEYETWFFDNVARTIQVGRNKKLAKKSKHTLTKIISGGYTSLGI